jgi:F-type H+-transporting ATPase subunit b
MGSALLALAESSIQLVPDGTLLLHGLIILIMVAVLNATLFKPINRILEERNQQTRGRLEEARLTLKEIDKKLKDYERALREARAEGYHLMEQQRAEALREREAKLSSVKEEVANFLSAQKRGIAHQADDVRSMLLSEARRIALEISARILGRPITGK